MCYIHLEKVSTHGALIRTCLCFSAFLALKKMCTKECFSLAWLEKEGTSSESYSRRFESCHHSIELNEEYLQVF